MSLDPAVLAYYSGLLIVQYQTKEKAKQTVELLANQGYVGGFVSEESACFDLETAEGAQLDVLGRIVGVPRNIYELDLSSLYMNLENYVDTPDPDFTIGMGRYTDSPYDPDGFLFFRYNFSNANTYTLLDFEMRILIKLKIILNNSYSSFKQIKELIFQYFEGVIDVVDNQDMTLTYNVNSSFTKVAEAAVSLKLLPKPMGVGLIVNYV